MVEVIWYFSQGLGVVTSSGRIECGGKERGEERDMRIKGRKGRGDRRKEEKKDGGTWRTVGDEGESDGERRGNRRHGLAWAGGGGRRSKEAKRGGEKRRWRKEGRRRKRRRRNKGNKEYGYFFSYVTMG